MSTGAKIMQWQDFNHKYYSSGPLRSKAVFWVMYTTYLGFPSSRKDKTADFLKNFFHKTGLVEECVAVWLWTS